MILAAAYPASKRPFQPIRGWRIAATARELLTRPVPDFPAEAIPIAVADIILERTGGQPYLLQLYASPLIAFLNDEKHRQACLEDVTTVEATVLSQGAHYFRHTEQAAPPAARAALAQGRPPGLEPHTRRWLRRRLLLTDDDRLLIPVLGAWLREEIG